MPGNVVAVTHHPVQHVVTHHPAQPVQSMGLAARVQKEAFMKPPALLQQNSSMSEDSESSSRNKVMLGSAPAMDIRGFRAQRLNGIYTLDLNRKVGEYGTYWDHKGRIFLYYQAQEKRWALSPLMDDTVNLLDKVQNHGSKKGLALEESYGKWTEYLNSENKWVQVNLNLRPARASPLPKVPVFHTPQGDAKAARAAETAPQETPARRTIIAYREKRNADGIRPIKLWSRPKSAQRLGDPQSHESKAQVVLEKCVDLEEMIMLREDDDKIEVALRFPGRPQSKDMVQRLLSEMLFPGLAPTSALPIDSAKYIELRKRSEATGNKSSETADKVKEEMKDTQSERKFARKDKEPHSDDTRQLEDHFKTQIMKDHKKEAAAAP